MARKTATRPKSPKPAPEPESDDVIEIDGAIFEAVADFPAHFVSQSSARVGGGFEVKVGVPMEGRNEVFSLMETAGEMLHLVAFRRVIDDTFQLEDTGG